MIANVDISLSFVVTLQEQLSLVENGAASIITSDGVRHSIHEPVMIGRDFIEFRAYGPGPEFPRTIVPFKTMASVIV